MKKIFNLQGLKKQKQILDKTNIDSNWFKFPNGEWHHIYLKKNNYEGILYIDGLEWKPVIKNKK